jgi:hypothetical protein
MAAVPTFKLVALHRGLMASIRVDPEDKTAAGDIDPGHLCAGQSAQHEPGNNGIVPVDAFLFGSFDIRWWYQSAPNLKPL